MRSASATSGFAAGASWQRSCTAAPAVAATDAALLRQASDAAIGRLQSLSDVSEELQMRLQMIMDRRAKLLEALSNIMKKQSDTAAAIAANLK